MLFFKSRNTVEAYKLLADTIKNDLQALFEKKGIEVTRINIDVKSNYLNLQVYVGQNQVDVSKE